ncbi:MAG: hypothetical protein K8T26_14800 [Lentisphaerae bacterium]|nr:hypothetical protein [Lentisphaerota bacterium]
MSGCASSPRQPTSSTFADDVAFLKRHTDAIVLSDATGQARIAIVPQYQARVMTSTAGGDAGASYGWINRRHIKSRRPVPHMNPYGGEDRFWMGPEGGQFALFFPPDAPFDLEHWQTPAVIDTEPFELAAASDTRAIFRKHAALSNRAGFTFRIEIERTVRLLNPLRVEELLGTPIPPSVACVAFESENRLTNRGSEPWTRETGLPSIWILGMFRPTPETTMVVPIQPGAEGDLGPAVIDTYFGKVPPERLIVHDNVLYFRGDGLYRSKIGIPPRRAKATVGSYDEAQGVLTLVNASLSAQARDYVNSLWEIQTAPFGGDVVNAYNDGPLDGSRAQLGPFYELETSSPALALAPGQQAAHTHRTFHFQGSEADLDAIARATLGVTLEAVKAAF